MSSVRDGLLLYHSLGSLLYHIMYSPLCGSRFHQEIMEERVRVRSVSLNVRSKTCEHEELKGRG